MSGNKKHIDFNWTQNFSICLFLIINIVTFNVTELSDMGIVASLTTTVLMPSFHC
jgi:hypothetical protein